jgi:hypothetical protein
VTQRRDNALDEHARECGECSEAAMPTAALSALLDSDAVSIDAERLSRLAFARVAPALQERAGALFWRRLTRVLVAALVPLPLVIGIDVWMLGRLYEAVAAWLPVSVAVYLVACYGASLLVLISGTYAAIPLLLARPIVGPEPEPAAA